VVVMGQALLLLLALSSAAATFANEADLPLRQWNLTFPKDPSAVARPPDPPNLRVAHCIAGDLRSLWLPSVYISYKRWAMEPLKAPSKLFYVVNYPPLSNFTRYKAAFDHLRPEKILFVKRDDVMNSNLRYENYAPYHRFYQYVKYSLCFELVRRYERSSLNGTLFSHIILTRPDALILPFGPVSAWRRDMIMAPPTEYQLKDPPVPIEVEQKWAQKGRGRDQLTEIINIVPRRVAHTLFSLLLKPPLPKMMKPGSNFNRGDNVWFELVRRAGLNHSFHPIEYHLVRDVNDRLNIHATTNTKKRLTPPDIVPDTMIIYRTE